ncbi:hypothetical protein ACFLZN_00390 [Nanoarchaeota archaeon]
MKFSFLHTKEETKYFKYFIQKGLDVNVEHLDHGLSVCHELLIKEMNYRLPFKFSLIFTKTKKDYQSTVEKIYCMGENRRQEFLKDCFYLDHKRFVFHLGNKTVGKKLLFFDGGGGLFHEYIHSIQFNYSGGSLCHWIVEGMAGYLAAKAYAKLLSKPSFLTTFIKGCEMAVVKSNLKPFSLAKLDFMTFREWSLNLKHGRGGFQYAQVYHVFWFGLKKIKFSMKQMMEFLKSFPENDDDYNIKFKRVFKISSKQFDTKYQNYITSKR